MAENYSVTAILSARDKNFGSVFGSAQSQADSLTKKLSSGLGFGVLTGIGMKAFSTITSAASGFAGELQSTSAAWKTFAQNAKMNDHTADEIKSTRKALQDFAAKTIYSASDMSTTYAQLDAVGIKSAESLVRGFGGIAAAAENPAQAMKTLSQQGVQMAAKPTVAWQDFKLMLEQTPAGIAAVAKEMGMTTAEMVTAIQDGEIKTQDFFDAVEKVGTSDAFTEMATQYKTVDQAMGGLTETVTNKLMPAFDLFQGYGIKAVEAVIGKLESIDGDAIAEEVKSVVDAFTENGLVGGVGKLAEYADRLPPSIKAAAAAAGALVGVNTVQSVLSSDVWQAGVSGAGAVADAIGSLPGAAKKGLRSVGKGFESMGYSALNFASRTCPQVLTGLSDMGTNAQALGGLLKSKTLDRFTTKFPKLTGALGKTASAVGKVGAGVIKTYGKMGAMVVKTMGVALHAVMPAAILGAALAGLGALYGQFGTQIDQMIALATEKGPEVITGLVGGITAKLPELISTGAQLVGNLLGMITANVPAIVQGGVSLVSGLVQGVASAAPSLMTKGAELIGTLVLSVVSAIPQLITTGMTLLASLAQGVASALPILAGYAMQAVTSFAQGIIGNLPQILNSALQIVLSLVAGINNSLPTLVSQGIQLIVYLAKSFVQNLPLIISTGIRIIAALVMGLIQAVPVIVQGAIQLVKSLIDTIINTDWIKVGGDIIDAIGNGVKAGFGGLKDLVGGLFSEDTTAAEGAAQQATAAAESTAQAYKDSSSYVSDAASQVGTEAQESLAASLSAIDVSGVGTTAATTLTSEFDAGISEMAGITDTAGAGVIDSLTATGTTAASNARQTTTNVVTALRSGVGPAKTAGKSVGSGYAGGIRGMSASASSAGSAVKSSALSGLSGGYGSAYSHGANIGQGLVDGMRSKVGAAWAAANSLAEAADKAIHARAQIGSPSKITIQYGKWIAEGLAVGIKSGTTGVVKQSKSLVKSLYKSMQKSTTKLGGVKDAASKYLKTFKTALQDKADSDLEYVENSLKKYRDVSKSYNTAITSLMKAYKTSYNKEVDRVISVVNSKLTTLAKTYQTKYDSIVSARTDFKEKLQETSLYTADDYGNVALADFSKQTASIKAYQANINKLKKLLPDGLMDEILGMSRENGLAYTNELLKKSSSWIKAYGKQYSQMMSAGSSVANTYYSGRLTALQKSYANDLKKVYADSKKEMNSIGKNVVQGMIDGMKSKKGALDSTGKALAKVVETAFKKQLKIHSPSKVMTEAGANTGQGVIDGIESKIKAARAAIANLLDTSSPETEISRRSGNMTLSDEYEYRSEAHYHITVESTMDGKKVGEGVADFVGDAIDKKNEREARKRGRRK